MKTKEVQKMTNLQTKALLKSIEIIIDLSPTKDQAKERIREISKELEKELTDTDQGNR